MAVTRSFRSLLPLTLLFGAAFLLLSGCSDSPTDPADRVESVEVSIDSPVLSFLGADAQISITVRDANGDPVPEAEATNPSCRSRATG